MNIIERMTDKQRECLIDEDEIEQEIRLCYRNFREAYEQAHLVKLPLKNEKGLDVVHGCGALISYVADYWLTRLTAVTRLGRAYITKNRQIELEQEMPDWNYMYYHAEYVHITTD
jgi:hypothetical protein